MRPRAGNCSHVLPVEPLASTKLDSFKFFRVSIGTRQAVADQGEFKFGKSGSETGYVKWVESRRVAAAELARQIGLPLGHLVEVWLRGQIRLRGKLRLQEEVLFIEEDRVRQLGLAVDHINFVYREMESCVRLD